MPLFPDRRLPPGCTPLFSPKEMISLINKKLMRFIVWIMLAAMLFSTVMYAIGAIAGL